MSKQVKISQTKIGEFFKMKEDSKTVYVRDTYYFAGACYTAHKFDDTNHFRKFKGAQLVWVGFTF